MKKSYYKQKDIVLRFLGVVLSLCGGVLVIHQVPIYFWYVLLFAFGSALLILLFFR